MRKIVKSIRSKLIVALLVIALVPLIGASLYNYTQTSKELVKNQKESVLSLVQSISQGMNEWLDRRMAEIKLAAKTEIIQSRDPNRVRPYLLKIKEQSDVYETVVLTDINGDVIATSSKTPQ